MLITSQSVISQRGSFNLKADLWAPTLLHIHRIRKQEMIRRIMMQIQLDGASDGR